MAGTISMQDMRYLNLLAKISKVRTRFCFKYNEAIYFCVPKHLVSRTIGPDAKNAKQISKILGRRIKIIAEPIGLEDAKRFISDIVAPVEFNQLSINENEIVLTAGSQSKAALLGRNKRRLLEMQEIVKNFFSKEFRII